MNEWMWWRVTADTTPPFEGYDGWTNRKLTEEEREKEKERETANDRRNYPIRLLTAGPRERQRHRETEGEREGATHRHIYIERKGEERDTDRDRGGETREIQQQIKRQSSSSLQLAQRRLCCTFKQLKQSQHKGNEYRERERQTLREKGRAKNTNDINHSLHPCNQDISREREDGSVKKQ